MEKLITVGTIAVIVGIVLIIVGTMMGYTKAAKGKTDVKSAGIIFIGPFPLGWASDKQTFYLLLTITAIMLIFYLVFFRRW